MIYTEDQIVKVNGVVLPGLVKSIEVKESAQIDEQEVEGSATKPKQATGYGVNIIALTRSGGSWELETVSAPFVRHSHKISVKHPKVSGEFEVSKVVSSTSENGFIRTKIYF